MSLCYGDCEVTPLWATKLGYSSMSHLSHLVMFRSQTVNSNPCLTPLAILAAMKFFPVLTVFPLCCPFTSAGCFSVYLPSLPVMPDKYFSYHYVSLYISKLLFCIGHYVYCLLIPAPFHTQLLCWVGLSVAILSRIGSKHRMTQSFLSLRP